MQERKNIHKGHRQRLKDKVRKGSLFTLQKHEMLELLLTYTIPQKDTNPLAHNLLNKYLGFANVLDAGYAELIKLNGIGQETALFLSILPQVFEAYKQDKLNNKDLKLKNTNACVSYFRRNYEIANKEKFYVVCLNSLQKAINTIEIDGTSDSNVNINTKQLISNITSVNTVAVVLYHTHPKGDVKPSDADLNTTKIIMQLCMYLGIAVHDHIILNNTQHYSMGSNGDLDLLKHNFNLTPPKHAQLKQAPKFSFLDSFEEAIKKNQPTQEEEE